MSTQLEIILVDGDQASPQSTAPRSGARPGGARADSPSAASTTRSPASAAAEVGVMDSLLKAAKDLAKSLGVGGLTTTVLDIVRLYRTAYSATSGLRGGRAGQGSQAAAGSASGAGGSGRSGDDGIIDAEFTVKPTGSDLVKAGAGAGSSAAGAATAGADAAAAIAGASAGGASAAGAGATAGAAAGLAGIAAVAAPVAIAVAAVGAASIATAKLVSMLGDAVKSEAERLSGFSGELSAATAMSDIRQTLADMRRAQAIGPQLADMENVRSRVSTAWQDAVTGLYELFGAFWDAARPFMEVVLKTLELGMVYLEAIFKFLEMFIDIFVSKDPLELLRDLKDLPKIAAKALKILTDWDNANADDANDPFAAQFMGMFNGQGVGGPGRAPRRNPGAPAPVGV